MIRVTADANVLVSAFAYPRGKPFEFLRNALEGKISLTVSQAIIDETLDVLARKFAYPAGDLADAKAVIMVAARTLSLRLNWTSSGKTRIRPDFGVRGQRRVRLHRQWR